jgi:hypothetical protein
VYVQKLGVLDGTHEGYLNFWILNVWILVAQKWGPLAVPCEYMSLQVSVNSGNFLKGRAAFNIRRTLVHGVTECHMWILYTML